ncbi:hypothetical protein K1719_026598 [Acacia pycnantha]|nr:hypothetical protein K1719_026598 [Acacia pycnantha]
MMEEELERMKEASQADPSIVVQPPARSPRHQKWKAARMKGDKYINADVAEVALKIDALEEQSSQGSFMPATWMDILSTAIGKADYPDAVRGETRGVKVTQIRARLTRFGVTYVTSLAMRLLIAFEGLTDRLKALADMTMLLCISPSQTPLLILLGI